MKKFKVIFVKRQSLEINKSNPIHLAEQNYTTEDPKVLLIPPLGYELLSITEILPPINQIKNEKIKN